jgi:hypothetical protein
VHVSIDCASEEECGTARGRRWLWWRGGEGGYICSVGQQEAGGGCGGDGGRGVYMQWIPSYLGSMGPEGAHIFEIACNFETLV